MDRTVPTHKRGYTTALIKKTSAVKPKKTVANYTGDNLSNRQIKTHVAGMQESSKTEGKILQKNLKAMISKLLKEEVSKKSLPLPSNKSRNNISTSLTQRKKSTKKKSKVDSIKEKSLKS